MFTPGGQIDLLVFGAARGGGKGSYSPPPSPPPTFTDPVSGKTYDTTADLNAGITQRQADEKAISDKAKADADAAKVAAHNTWLGTRDTAKTNATNEVLDTFRKAGVDPNNYLESDINPTINRYYSSIQDDDPNVASVFPTDLGSQIVNKVTGGKRTAASTALDNIFTPTYAQDKLADSSLDPYVNTLLDEQFNPLSVGLTNAQKRGTLNDQGYQAALDAMSSKRTAGADTVRTLGQGILGTERSSLNDYITGARNNAANLTLAGADKFDANTYKTGAENMVASDLSGLGGALRNAVGSTKFADLTELLNAGGAVQGVTNPAASQKPGDGTLGANILEDDKKRGLGSQGAF